MGTLSNPTVVVNDDTISILPNSLSYKEGQGDAKVRPLSAGGDAIEVVVTSDAETKASMVKFKVSNSDTHLGQVNEWLLARSDGGVTITLSEGDISIPFTGMIMTTEPERSVGADGEVEVEFMGPPVA